MKYTLPTLLTTAVVAVLPAAASASPLANEQHATSVSTAGDTIAWSSYDNGRYKLMLDQGGTIAAPLGRADVFPTMVTHMVSVGEETGQLEQMLSKIADFYEAEVDAKVKALTSLIEPLMIIFVGVVVGYIVISMYLPIFSLYDKIK